MGAGVQNRQLGKTRSWIQDGSAALSLALQSPESGLSTGAGDTMKKEQGPALDRGE